MEQVEKKLSMRWNRLSVAGMLLLVWIGCVVTGQPSAVSADTGAAAADDAAAPDLDDLLEQFDADDASPVPDRAETAPSPPPAMNHSISGKFSLSTAYNVAHAPPPPGQTDWRGLSRLRSLLAVEVDVDPSDVLSIHASGYGFYDAAYAINGRNNYTPQVLDTYEEELELTETYALLSPVPNIDLRFGRQILVWGTSDNLRVTDVLNPLDLREPGLTDLEYLRLPVAMSRMDYYLRGWRFSAAAIHEIRFDKTPPYGSDYFPLSTPLPPEDNPSTWGADTEWAFSAGKAFSGWDMAVYAANHFNDSAHLETAPPGAASPFIRRHARLNMVGAAASVAVGNWLLKSEAAWQDGFQYGVAPGETFNRLDVLVGLEYSGFSETTVSIEAANREVLDFDDRLRMAQADAQPESFQSALRVVREFMNDTLTVTFLAMTYGPLGQDGAFQRFQVQYDLRDNIEITGGVVFYQSGDRTEFSTIGDNDRLFAEVAYHF